MAFITLIRPPTVSTPKAYSVPITPPLGLAYIAAALDAAGHQTVIVDAVGEAPMNCGPTGHPKLIFNGLGIDEIVARIDPGTDGIGVSTMFSQEWPHTEQLIRAIRERFPGVPLFVGGEHATAAWDHVLQTCPDVTLCVLGEGEETSVDVATFLTGDTALDDIAGIAYGDASGRPVRTRPRKRITALGDIPRPAWHKVPMQAYLSGGFGHGVDLGRSMPILATRGCPYQCTFCSNPAMWTTRYYMRDVVDVVDEIEDYVQRYHATNIDFYDLTAIIKRPWVLAFCAELERRDLRITWQLPSGTRTEVLDADVLAAFYRTGCRNITYAPESGSQRTLERIRKRVSLPRLLESVRAAKQVGIALKCNLIIGFPDETRMDVLRTMRFALTLAWRGVDDVPLYLFSPYPGSALFRYLREKGVIASMDDDYFASLGCFMDLTTSSRFCERIGPRELNAYRLIGMAAAYATGYVTRPWRTVRSLRNVLADRSRTVLEQRLCDLKKRRLSAWRQSRWGDRLQRAGARLAAILPPPARPG